MKRAFSIHSDFYEELKNLTVEQRAALLLALINWAEDEEDDESRAQLDGESAVLFRLMRAQIMRISKANSRNGEQGGAPPENSNAAKTGKNKQNARKQAKQANPVKTSPPYPYPYPYPYPFPYPIPYPIQAIVLAKVKKIIPTVATMTTTRARARNPGRRRRRRRYFLRPFLPRQGNRGNQENRANPSIALILPPSPGSGR
ncbi:MAG: DUF6291 domain-containing protein [Synergistaceae bacterium]|nr:DUF6291 domain-containing protein [Synergistaceae bacterium]